MRRGIVYDARVRAGGIALYGLATGGVASIVQLLWVGFGAIPPGELWKLFGAFVLAGVAVALAADAVGGLLRRRSGGWPPAALALTPIFFAVAIPLNVRGAPDVYLVVSDTTRADHLSLYGYPKPTTEFLEQYAADAVVFENAVSQGSHTIVSTPSILSSRYPSEHGMSRYSDLLPEDLPLVSQPLQTAGYRTYAHVTNPHLAPDRGFDRGFDEYQYEGRWRHAPAVVVTKHFLGWLDEQPAESPIFAFLFYLDPHSPYAPSRAVRRRFNPDPLERPFVKWPKGRGAPPSDSVELRSLVAGYDGSISLIDSEIGTLVAALERRGRYDDALLIYTSDHGEEFFEHGEWGHDRTLFEESIRVPLVVSAPSPLRFPRMGRWSGVSPVVASSVDVAPTILEAAGLPPDAAARGRSLLPAVRGQEPPPEEDFAYNEQILEAYGPYDLRGIRTRDHKYVRVLRSGENRTARDFFFDLRADPGERKNLLESDPEAGRAHREKLDAMMGEMSALAPPVNPQQPLDPGRVKLLEALGYVGAEAD